MNCYFYEIFKKNFTSSCGFIFDIHVCISCGIAVFGICYFIVVSYIYTHCKCQFSCSISGVSIHWAVFIYTAVVYPHVIRCSDLYTYLDDCYSIYSVCMFVFHVLTFTKYIYNLYEQRIIKFRLFFLIDCLDCILYK
mgnify:CR=1 FL=1